MPQQPARPLTAKDIYQFNLISNPVYSPASNQIAHVVTTIDEETNGYLSSIYVASSGEAEPRRLTTAKAKDSRPRWSPDGKHLAFISNRSETPQIWMILLSGGEAWQVSELDEGVTDFSWSPDGTRFVAVSKSVQASDSTDGDQSTAGDEAEQSDVKHITKIRYKSNDEGFLDFKPAHLWIIPAFDGEPTQLTNADIDDKSPVWSPNGNEIAFVTNRTEGREWNTVSEIWTISSSGSGEQRILGGDTASFDSPCWSPDSTQIAATGHWEAQAGGAPDADVWVAHAGGGEPRNLTQAFSRSVGDVAMSDVFAGSTHELIWAPDGQSLYFLSSDSGSTHIYQVPASGGDPFQITHGERRISGLSVGSDGRKIAYIAATTTNPGDLYESDINGGQEKALTAVNEPFLSGIALSEPEPFTVQSQSDDTPVHGWVLKPLGFDPAKKYPMILQIHGGPHAMYANAFMHELQLMAARGYVVVYTNPRGSSGYGEPFTRASHTRWGETDMPDLMAAVDYVLEQGYIDETCMGVTGGSYGGYMTLWLIGHTDRFKAAVTQRCVSNLYSFYGTSDIGWTFMDYEFGGRAWENREHFMKYSPITYVESMTTPLLIVHSELDYRCPIEQAEQVFISLKTLGRDVEFVRIPDENHDLSRNGKPKHRIERLEHIIGWFDRYL